MRVSQKTYRLHSPTNFAQYQAIAEASNNPNIFPEIFSSVKGIVFLGTPFRGTEQSLSQGKILRAAEIKYAGIAPVQPAILSTLNPENETLGDVIGGFFRAYQNAGRPPPAMCCFFETKPANVWGIVKEQRQKVRISSYAWKGRSLTFSQVILVNKSSGCLDMADNHQLYRTHFDMNKFGHPADTEYIQVSKKISELVGPEVISNEPHSRRHSHQAVPSAVHQLRPGHEPEDGEADNVRPGLPLLRDCD